MSESIFKRPCLYRLTNLGISLSGTQLPTYDHLMVRSSAAKVT